MEYAGIYIHVPFCLQKCPYCNFYSIPATTEALDAYTTAVCRNLRGYAENIRVDTIYLGGGTPSLLSPAQVEQILETAADCFLVTADAEITLEANPASCTPAAWKSFRKIGINRLSVGVQSLNDAELKQLGRLHTAAQAVSTIKAAADAGFQNLSGDLMLAIPEQTTETLAQTLHQLTALPLTHISAYLLKIEPTTRFAAQHIEARCPSDDDAAALYLQTVSALDRQAFCNMKSQTLQNPA